MGPLSAAGKDEDHLAVFRAGHEWWNVTSPRWSAVIHMAYGDLSGTEKEILTAGCYLGQETPWMDAIADWCKALHDADVDEFHATDFFNAWGEFNHDKWRRFDPEKEKMVPGGPLHEEFAERFTAIPVRRGLVGFALSLDVPAFMEILAPELAKEKRAHSAARPRTHAIMRSLASAGEFLETTQYREESRIQAIFEHEKGAGKFVSYFDESKARRERWTWWYKSFTTADKSFVPTQMGDLLAHETWRRTKQVWSGDPHKLRASFEQMLGDGRIRLDAMTRQDCIRAAEQTRDVLARYPDGLVPDGRPV